MNTEFLKQAHERVPSIPVLVNLISKRTKQLIAGEKPLVKPLSSDEDKVDTALREVAEGRLISEVDFDVSRPLDVKLLDVVSAIEVDRQVLVYHQIVCSDVDDVQGDIGKRCRATTHGVLALGKLLVVNGDPCKRRRRKREGGCGHNGKRKCGCAPYGPNLCFSHF